MSKVESNLLTPNQFTKLTILTMLGVGVFSLPNDMVKEAKQDGWLTAMISVIYPLYFVFMAGFLSKRHPNENILQLSKKYLGTIFGNVVNFTFLLIFVFYFILEATGIDTFLRTYLLEFLSSFQFLMIFIPLTAFAAYRGLKVLSTVSEIVFYNYILIGVVTLLVLYRGSYLNVMPVLNGEVFNIVKGMKYGLYYYSGIEMLLLVYPYSNDKDKIMTAGIKGTLITCFMYTWATFATIYYLGVSTINKTLWAGLYIVESLRLPIINNFRIAILFLWVFISITVASLYYYSCGVIIKDCIKNLNRKIIFVTTIPFLLILSLYLGNEVSRRELIVRLMPFVAIFNILYVSIIALLVYIKKDGNHEK